MPPHAHNEVEAVDDTHAVPTVGAFSIKSLADRRSKAAPMPKGVAPVTSSDFFKGSQDGKPKAQRWDKFLSPEANLRQPSSLKNTAKYLANEGLISLGGGIPASEFFPFERLDVKVPKAALFSEEDTHTQGVLSSMGKYDITEGKGDYDLSIALNYGQGTGAPQLLRFITEHTEIVHNPPYSDWQCAATAGSTSSLEMAFRMLTKPGDLLITDEYTFATAVETARPLGVGSIGIKMDAEGMIPVDLDKVLSSWDPSAHNGAKRPFLVYTVPSGQNPTGSTMGTQRRKDLYAIFQKHDLYVIEDEPYYFLQMQPWAGTDAAAPPPPASHEEFIKGLVPSLLSLDVDGRVMRLDSFSKILAPGFRTGWITASEQIIERFVRHSEVSTQNPSGFSQAILYKLLEVEWGHEGFLDWLINIRMRYTSRRNVILDACEKYLPKQVASWNPPMAGMFHWINIDWHKHPAAKTMPFLELEEQIFQAAIAEKSLLVKGSLFRAENDGGKDMFFRATFAAAPPPGITEAIRRFGIALRKEFGIDA